MINSMSLSAVAAFAALATFGSATNSQAQTGQPGVYNFTLNSFRITDTRSLHNDTDFVSIAVAVGKNAPITVPTKPMGDVNNGTHTVNLTIPNVSVGPNDTVAFSYSIVNTGFDKNSVEHALQSATNAAASKIAAAGGGALGGIISGGSGAGIGAMIGDKAGAWLIGKLDTIIFANCDGTVAAADHAFTADALARSTHNGAVLSSTDDNKGTNSPHGCGRNSRYYVSWKVTGQQQAGGGGSGGGGGGGGGGPPKCQPNGENCIRPK
jgi:hypothetical protein